MKKRLLSLIAVFMVSVLGMLAQSDKLIGNYLIDYEGKQSKVKFYKYENGYRGQIYWVREGKNADGSVKKDVKNPDKSKRGIPVGEIVIIDKVVYDGEKVWDGGHIYDPTSGKSYRVDVRFKDDKTLELRGKLGPFFKRIYWKKI